VDNAAILVTIVRPRIRAIIQAHHQERKLSFSSSVCENGLKWRLQKEHSHNTTLTVMYLFTAVTAHRKKFYARLCKDSFEVAFITANSDAVNKMSKIKVNLVHLFIQ
jgi:hypothetical protein